MNRTEQPSVNLIDTIQLPEVKKVTLDNGVPVYILNEGEQEVVKIELLFKAGKWYETKNLVADLTSRMLREGTTGHTAKQLADIFDYEGANINYGTGFETGGATLYSLSNRVSTLLPLLHEVFTTAVFPQHEFETIINNRKQKLKVNLEKNEFLANRHFVNALYGQRHPYGRVTNFEDFDVIGISDLQQFYRQYYTPANLTIIVSGRFNDSLVNELNKYFGTGQRTEAAKNDITYPIESSAQLVHHTEKADSVQSAVVLGNLSINKTHPDFLKLSVLNTVFGGYFGSRLMSNIREEKGYTYGIYSSIVSYPHGGFIEIAAEVGKQVRQATIDEIEREMNLLRTELIDEEELEIVKNYISGRILRSVDGPLKFSETLKGLIIYNQDVEYIHRFLQTVQQVTAQELNTLAIKYFNFDKMYQISVG